MRPTQSLRPQTTGSAGFNPDAFFESWVKDSSSLLPQNNDLRASIIESFNLSQSDRFVYNTIASVTLAQVQQAIGHTGENGLHAWYPNRDGEPSEVHDHYLF